MILALWFSNGSFQSWPNCGTRDVFKIGSRWVFFFKIKKKKRFYTRTYVEPATKAHAILLIFPSIQKKVSQSYQIWKRQEEIDFESNMICELHFVKAIQDEIYHTKDVKVKHHIFIYFIHFCIICTQGEKKIWLPIKVQFCIYSAMTILLWWNQIWH